LATCYACHGKDYRPGASNVHNPSLGGYDALTHTATMTAANVTILGTDFGSHSCAECHASSELGVLHVGGCATCHPALADSAKPWNKSCVTAGCHTVGSSAPMHGAVDAAHVIGGQTCTAVGCHSGEGNVAAVHTKEGCATCHGAGKTPTLNCVASGCHADMSGHGDVTAIHASGITSAQITFFDSSSDHGRDRGAADVLADCSLCHTSTNLLSLHGGDCSICHSGSSAPRSSFGAWNKTCSQGSCHATYHDGASLGHDAEYDGGTSCSCHDSGIPESSAPITASVDYCGGCHATSPDTTAPTTVFENALASYVGPVSVALTATDDRKVKATYYRLDGGPTQKLSGSNPVIAAPVSGVQGHTLEFWSTDWAGNVETPHGMASFLVFADTQPPVTTSNAAPSYTGPVVIKLSATDNATSLGAKTTYYRFDNGATLSGTTAQLPQPATGTETHTLHFWSVDYSGNIEGENSATFTVTSDNFAPTTTSDLLPAPKWYPNGKIVINLTSVDASPSSGIVGVRVGSSNGNAWWGDGHDAGYDAGTGTWQLGMWTFASGEYPVTWYASDAAGNAEVPNTTTIRVDAQAPTVACNAQYGHTYLGAQMFTLTPSDLGGSGVAETQYRVDSGPWTSGISIPVPAPASGTAGRTIAWIAKDGAGNQASGSTMVYIQAGADTTAPTGSILINSGSAWATTTAVAIAPSATDDVGVSQMQFSNDGVSWSTWEAYSAAAKSWALTTGNGAKTVYARYRDAAGNLSATATDTIGLDGAAPSTTSNVVSGTTYSGAQVFSLTPTDAGGSGIASTWWQLDSTAGAWTGGTTVVVAAPSSGSVPHTLYWYSKDVATNSETVQSVAFNVAAPAADIIAPSGSVTINAGSAWANSTAATLAPAATDNVGVDQMRFSNDGASWSTWEAYSTATKYWTLSSGDGTKTVYAQYKDAAGNVSANSTDTISLDTLAPVTSHVTNAPSAGSGSVALSATDAGSGAHATTYILTTGGVAGAVQTYGSPILLAAPATGSTVYSVEYWSVDNATNSETPHKLTGSITINASSGTATLSATLTSSSWHAYAHFVFYDEFGSVIGDSGWGADEHTSTYSLVVPAGHQYTMFVEWEPPDYETFDAGSASFPVTPAQAAPGATVPWVVNY
jgi:hypothetical protein